MDTRPFVVRCMTELSNDQLGDGPGWPAYPLWGTFGDRGDGTVILATGIVAVCRRSPRDHDLFEVFLGARRVLGFTTLGAQRHLVAVRVDGRLMRPLGCGFDFDLAEYTTAVIYHNQRREQPPTRVLPPRAHAEMIRRFAAGA